MMTSNNDLVQTFSAYKIVLADNGRLDRNDLCYDAKEIYLGEQVICCIMFNLKFYFILSFY